MRKQFGAKPNKEELDRYATSKNWDGEKFVNFEKTGINISFQDIPKLLYKQFLDKKEREPKADISILSVNFKEFLKPSREAKFIWYGHSVLLMRIQETTILIDPMLGQNAAPISPFSVNRFSENTLELIDQFPEIDLALISHDHYDHLDLKSIKKLQGKVKKFGVALGVKRHLTKWGVEESIITEFDWWDDISINDIKITFTPSRHFSGRGLKDRAKSLWGGWVFKTSEENIWFSGDGGYGEHFKEIGEKMGPFDLGFIECGQYNEKWHQIHMFPKECIKASKEAGAKKVMPVHWGAFALAHHPWKEPVEKFLEVAEKENLEVLKPEPGEIFKIRDKFLYSWWEKYE